MHVCVKGREDDAEEEEWKTQRGLHKFLLTLYYIIRLKCSTKRKVNTKIYIT